MLPFAQKNMAGLWIMSNLCAEMEVAEKDGRFGAGDHQDNEDQEQEAVHVVDLR